MMGLTPHHYYFCTTISTSLNTESARLVQPSAVQVVVFC